MAFIYFFFNILFRSLLFSPSYFFVLFLSGAFRSLLFFKCILKLHYSPAVIIIIFPFFYFIFPFLIPNTFLVWILVILFLYYFFHLFVIYSVFFFLEFYSSFFIFLGFLFVYLLSSFSFSFLFFLSLLLRWMVYCILWLSSFPLISVFLFARTGFILRHY